MANHKGGRHDNLTKNKRNPNQIAKTSNQPRRTILNKIRKMAKRVRMNPNDQIALEALIRTQARK